MKFGPFEISLREKAVVGPTVLPASFGAASGWWPTVKESFTGAWQRNIEVRRDLVLAYWAVYSCITLIAGDIGKLCPKLMEEMAAGNSEEATSSAFSPVLDRPNPYQTWQQFAEYWVTSKLTHGNAYVYLQRDNRRVVVEMHVLNPFRVVPLVGPMDGAVFYQLGEDRLVGLQSTEVVAVPASEIIHDRMNCLFHPLMGVPPIYACGLAATQGLKIQENSAKFFGNMSRPSGILTAPKSIGDDTANRLKEHWENNYRDGNLGKIAVLGDGLKYEAMTMSAEESQMVDQLKLTAEVVCSTFHVPAYMIGVGPVPPYNNIEAINQQYYNTCLQVHIESIEAGLNYGLGLGKDRGDVGGPLEIELDLDGLLRMDSATQAKTLGDLVAAGIAKPDEARLKLNMAPVAGGDTPYLQQQNYSLAALAKRDASADPFGTAKPAPTPTATPAVDPAPPDATKAIADGLQSIRALIETAEESERARVLREADADVRRKEDESRVASELELLTQREAAIAEREVALQADSERIQREHAERVRADQEAIETRVAAQIDTERRQFEVERETKAREDESTEDFAAVLIAKFSALGNAD